MRGGAGRGYEKGAGMFCFFIQEVVAQVFSLCETSLVSKFMIHALFCVYVILLKKIQKILFKSKALASPKSP